MEFEEMQVIWNQQEEKKMFAIDEAALYESIKGKSRSLEHWLVFVEGMMIVLNLVVAGVLVVDTIRDGGPALQFLVAAMYGAYSLFGAYRRVGRRREEVHFTETMLGELEKAIWRADYLIAQGRTLIVWYLLPLVVVGAGFLALDGNVLEAALMLLVLPLTHLGVRWEIRKWHRPKKEALESLRDTLLEANGGGPERATP